MNKEVEHVNAKPQKKKPRSLESAAEAASKTFLDKVPKDLVEPENFASGGDMDNILDEDNETDY
ncbi:MAG: hypothetical protein COB04_19275 [Gammaproteobacteria bacterium]|nr:MAG: hypothetical protein COB04_19275 [Gammaproteobacteria bacterium]